MDIVRITWRNFRWFAPLLSADAGRDLLQKETCFGIGAVTDQTACGAAICEVHEKVVEVNFLFVAPAYRRQHAATQMMKELSGNLPEGSAICITYSCQKADEELPLFFGSLEGFQITRQDDIYASLSIQNLNHMSFKVGGKERIDAGREFFTLSAIKQRKFQQMLAEEGIFCPLELPREEAAYLPELCRYTGDAEHISGAVFIRKLEKNLYLDFAYMEKNSENSFMDLLEAERMLVCRLLEERAKESDAEPRLYVSAVREASVRLLEHLCPDFRIERVVYEANREGGQ